METSEGSGRDSGRFTETIETETRGLSKQLVEAFEGPGTLDLEHTETVSGLLSKTVLGKSEEIFVDCN